MVLVVGISRFRFGIKWSSILWFSTIVTYYCTYIPNCLLWVDQFQSRLSTCIMIPNCENNLFCIVIHLKHAISEQVVPSWFSFQQL